MLALYKLFHVQEPAGVDHNRGSNQKAKSVTDCPTAVSHYHCNLARFLRGVVYEASERASSENNLVVHIYTDKHAVFSLFATDRYVSEALAD